MRRMSTAPLDRRRFLGFTLGGVGLGLVGTSLPATTSPWGGPKAGPRGRDELFPISLAQWSLHRALRKGELDNLDFPQKTRSFGIGAVEYVNQFFKDKARDEAYLQELKKRCDGEGVKSLLIMCDGEGALGDPNAAARQRAIDNHVPWVVAAKALGCHSIRVNAQSSGSWEEQQKLAADGLRRLCEAADPHGIDVIVENHGGLSSNGKWLSQTLALVGHARVGALPDFGNFRVSKDEVYDRYEGVAELMPFARGVSAKSHDFDERGEEIHTDYTKMLAIVVVEHGWRGHVGIEYEGGSLSEDMGIKATKLLLERVRDQLAPKARANEVRKKLDEKQHERKDGK
jgi:L-ribulose-5-phosphate 3-epimerase